MDHWEITKPENNCINPGVVILPLPPLLTLHKVIMDLIAIWLNFCVVVKRSRQFFSADVWKNKMLRIE